MQYEFFKTTWMEEDPPGEIQRENIEKMHQDVEDRIRLSIDALIESQENFLGRGMTAEVHFLENDSKLCYKIIRTLDVMARPEAADNIPAKYRNIYDKKKAAQEKASKNPFPPATTDKVWHVDLFAEAEYLARARKSAEGTSVTIPRPLARMEIKGKEEGEGFEIADNLEVLLMERMDATSVDDLMLKQLLPPLGFNADTFCAQVDEYLKKMHGDNLYHRDLHAGNTMIDNQTGFPVVIDFGRSTVAPEEDAYIEEIGPGKKMHFIQDEQMFRDKVRNPLREYLRYREVDKSKI